jgi:hypothetical protein
MIVGLKNCRGPSFLDRRSHYEFANEVLAGDISDVNAIRDDSIYKSCSRNDPQRHSFLHAEYI